MFGAFDAKLVLASLTVFCHCVCVCVCVLLLCDGHTVCDQYFCFNKIKVYCKNISTTRTYSNIHVSINKTKTAHPIIMSHFSPIGNSLTLFSKFLKFFEISNHPDAQR